MQKLRILGMAILAAIFTLGGCDKDETPGLTVRLPDGDGFEWLSDYNFFSGELSQLNPNTDAGVLPYDLNVALFSDYAFKKRFIYVSEGSTISFDTTDVLDLPSGSAFIKHFYYVAPNGSQDNIETRLLIKQGDSWQAETYIWNEEQIDAQRSLVGGTLELTTFANGVNQSFNYLVPNQNQCKNCHSDNAKIKPVGPRIQNLNKDFQYDFGVANQLSTWMERGILEQASLHNISSWPSIDDDLSDINNRARAYLDVNCASCHHLKGSAANSGLYLEYENVDSISIGIWKLPIAAGGGSGGFTYVIHPGEADQSILLYRMVSVEVDERMPEIGRDLIHDEGVELVRDWINSL